MRYRSWRVGAQVGPCSCRRQAPTEVAGKTRAFKEQEDDMDRAALGVLGVAAVLATGCGNGGGTPHDVEVGEETRETSVGSDGAADSDDLMTACLYDDLVELQPEEEVLVEEESELVDPSYPRFDADYIYVLSDETAVYRAPLAGGAVELVGEFDGDTWSDFEVAPEAVYARGGESLYILPKDGGEMRSVHVGGYPLSVGRTVLTDKTHAYTIAAPSVFCDLEDGILVTIDLQSDERSELASGFLCPDNLAQDDDSVFVMARGELDPETDEHPDATLWRVAKSDGTVERVASAHWAQMVTQGKYVYGLDRSGEITKVMRVAKAGGKPEQVDRPGCFSQDIVMASGSQVMFSDSNVCYLLGVDGELEARVWDACSSWQADWVLGLHDGAVYNLSSGIRRYRL